MDARLGLGGGAMSLEQPPELHAPHAGRSGRWFEMLVSISALAVSAVSIFIALQHGDTMEKLVAANSVPYVEIMSANAVRGVDGEFREAILLELRNVGVGPANVRSVRLLTNGRAVRSVDEWLSLCCEEDAGLARETVEDMNFVLNQSATHFIPAGENVMLAYAPRTDENAEAFSRADAVRVRSRLEICYCSVFDECWSRRDGAEPAPVRACDAPDDRFIP